MPNTNFASLLLAIAIIAAIMPPGYPAYIGAYIAMIAALLALLTYGWRDAAAFRHPTLLAILAALALVTATVPFVYQGPQDLLGPVFILPMFTTIGVGLLARRARHVPNSEAFATICVVAALIALAAGAYEAYVLDIDRPGLGNNPIHYGTLAVMSGSLAMVGVASGKTPWRYLFLLGPIFGLGCAVISGSRGPMMGGLAMTGIGGLILSIWLWHDRLFRLAFLVSAAIGTGSVAYFIGTGNSRVMGLFDSVFNIFRFTGTTDDIRAALYSSALDVLRNSPIVGVGLGQIMLTAQRLHPEQAEVFTLDNLHADWANLATMAGGLGLAAYILLLAAPLLLLLDRDARCDRSIVLGAVLLTVGQLTLGISNAMFGILPQTMVYAVALGYFLVRATRRQDLY